MQIEREIALARLRAAIKQLREAGATGMLRNTGGLVFSTTQGFHWDLPHGDSNPGHLDLGHIDGAHIDGIHLDGYSDSAHDDSQHGDGGHDDNGGHVDVRHVDGGHDDNGGHVDIRHDDGGHDDNGGHVDVRHVDGGHDDGGHGDDASWSQLIPLIDEIETILVSFQQEMIQSIEQRLAQRAEETLNVVSVLVQRVQALEATMSARQTESN